MAFTLTTIQPTDCIGYSRETINSNFSTLSSYVVNNQPALPIATSSLRGGVVIGSGLSINTAGVLSVPIDNITIQLVNNKLVAQIPQIVNSSNQATYIAGSGVAITYSVLNGLPTINAQIDNDTILFNSNNKLSVNLPRVTSNVTYPVATSASAGGVKVGSGVYATADGTLSIKIDNSTIKLNQFNELTVNIPQVPYAEKGYKAFLQPGTYSWSVPEGVNWLKVYAVAGGAGDKGQANGGSTFFGSLISVTGGKGIDGKAVGGSAILNQGASGLVFTGSSTSTTIANQGFNLFHNLRINNTYQLSPDGVLPGQSGDYQSGAGGAAIAYIHVQPKQLIKNITVGAGGGTTTIGEGGMIILEY